MSSPTGFRGSDIIAPRVRALIQNHRTRPITARVTLTRGVTDVVKIFRHLREDLGFHEVGFAPVTTSPDRLYSINEQGMNGVLDQFHALADEWLDTVSICMDFQTSPYSSRGLLVAQ